MESSVSSLVKEMGEKPSTSREIDASGWIQGGKIKGIMRTEGSPVKNGKFKQTSERSYRAETSWTVFEQVWEVEIAVFNTLY